MNISLPSRHLLDPDADPAVLQSIVSLAAQRTAAAMCDMTGRCIEARSAIPRCVPLAHLSMAAGDPERSLFMVYVRVDGEIGGHLLLTISEPTALRLVDILLDQPEATSETLGELEISALAETGNVAVSHFLTALAEQLDLPLPPTPPLVLHEMCGTVLDTLAAELAMSDDRALMIESEFACDGTMIDFALFMFPGVGLFETAIPNEQGATDARHGS